MSTPRPKRRFQFGLRKLLLVLVAVELVLVLSLWSYVWLPLREEEFVAYALALACVCGLLWAMLRKFARHRFQFSLRTLLLSVLLVSLLASYGGSYYRLSRRGMEEAAQYNMDGFLYVPYDEVSATEDLTQHHRRAWFFAPANWIDRHFFGGPGPVGDITFRLSTRHSILMSRARLTA